MLIDLDNSLTQKKINSLTQKRINSLTQKRINSLTLLWYMWPEYLRLACAFYLELSLLSHFPPK